MTQRQPVQCPICGWTGHASELEDAASGSECPTCGEPIRAAAE